MNQSGRKFHQNNNKKKSVQQTRATGSFLPCRPCARNMLAPDASFILIFDFFLSYFILFVLFLFPLFCVFVSVFVLICSFCVSTPPLLCLQLAPSVSNHPSDLSPFCMHCPYTPLLCAAWQSTAVALTLPCLTNTGFASHSVPSELLWW